MTKSSAQKETIHEKHCLYYYFYSDRYGSFVCPRQGRQQQHEPKR